MFQKEIVFFIILLFIFNKLFAQSAPDCKRIEDQKKSFVPILLSIPHTTNTNSNPGQTFSFNYPGFLSMYGQANLFYTNSNGDSYFFGVGGFFLMAGVNKHILKINQSELYVNLNLGAVYKGYLGILGLSYIKSMNNNEKMEFTFDSYFHHGTDGDMYIQDLPYLRGLAAMVHYSLKLNKRILFTLSGGLSLIQYRYMKYKNIIVNDSIYTYVSWETEKYYSEEDTDFLVDPKWDTHFVFPLSITMSYHF